MLTDEQIIKEVLLYLDTWVINDEINDAINESPYMTESELHRQANKYIGSEEIISFFNNTKDEYVLRTKHQNDDILFEKIICIIVAGRLWNKYNINTTTEDEESTFIDNYGKKLILQGEKAIRPYIQQKIRGLNAIK